jgi:hypothetical protein
VSSDHIVEPEYTNIITKVFETLPRFINIRSLTFVAVDLTQFPLQQISTLSLLEELSSVYSIVPPKTDSMPMLRPRIFSCMDDSNPENWLTLLDQDHLQVLRIPLSDSVCSFFFANIDPSICPFPSLQVADLEIEQETLPMLPRFLSKTPTLRSLQLGLVKSDPGQYIRIMEGLAPPTTCPVPYLDEYGGPHRLLPIILGRATGFPSARLCRLFLESVNDAGDPLDAFMNSFKLCHPLQLRDVTHLHLSWLDSMDFRALVTLRDIFPVLQEFYLHASEECCPSGLSCEFSEIPASFDPTLPLCLDRCTKY